MDTALFMCVAQLRQQTGEQFPFPDEAEACPKPHGHFELIQAVSKILFQRLIF